jgi:hypothetical protein
MDFDATFSTSRLVSEFPGVIAGPDFPPACGVGALWQLKQFALKIGRTSASKLGDLTVSPAAVIAHIASQKGSLTAFSR